MDTLIHDAPPTSGDLATTSPSTLVATDWTYHVSSGGNSNIVAHIWNKFTNQVTDYPALSNVTGTGAIPSQTFTNLDANTPYGLYYSSEETSGGAISLSDTLVQSTLSPIQAQIEDIGTPSFVGNHVFIDVLANGGGLSGNETGALFIDNQQQGFSATVPSLTGDFHHTFSFPVISDTYYEFRVTIDQGGENPMEKSEFFTSPLFTGLDDAAAPLAKLIIVRNTVSGDATFKVESPDVEQIVVEVYTMKGQMLFAEKGMTGEQVSVSLNNYSPGMYLAKITSGSFEKTIQLGKIK